MHITHHSGTSDECFIHLREKTRNSSNFFLIWKTPHWEGNKFEVSLTGLLQPLRREFKFFVCGGDFLNNFHFSSHSRSFTQTSFALIFLGSSPLFVTDIEHYFTPPFPLHYGMLWRDIMLLNFIYGFRWATTIFYGFQRYCENAPSPCAGDVFPIAIFTGHLLIKKTRTPGKNVEYYSQNKNGILLWTRAMVSWLHIGVRNGVYSIIGRSLCRD